MDVDFDPELHTVPPDRRALSDQPKWRRDFPIDEAQDAYVARRDFTKFMGLTSLAFVVGQFWIAIQSRLRRTRGALPIVQVAKVDELPIGGAKVFYYPTEIDPALLLRLDTDQFLAYSSQCTHLQCPVIPQMDAGRLHCPCHAGNFDLRTGQPISGPPRRPLRRITLKIENSLLYATGVERGAG